MTKDVSGETADAEHQLFKTRLDKEGNTIETEKVKELNLAKNRDSRDAENGELEKCGSCYGAESETHKCCQTCEDVLSAYREKGWGVDDPRKFEQCEKGKNHTFLHGKLNIFRGIRWRRFRCNKG